MTVVLDNPFDYYPTYNDSKITVGIHKKLCLGTMPTSCNLIAVITAVVAICGIVSNARTFLSTIRDKPWGHRLSRYVQVLYLWDTGLLISIFSLKVLICLWFNQRLMHQWSPVESLLTLSLGSLCDLCVTGSTWVMVAITAERYMAVAQPLRERMRNKNSVKWISAAIVIFSITINLPRNVLEYYLSDCISVGMDGVEVNHDAIRFYAIFGRIIPDLLFRSPAPIVISIFLTFKIIKHRRERLSCKEHRDLLPNMSNDSGVHSTSSRTENIKSPLMLAVLNGKFLLCNIMYIGVTAMQWLDYGSIADPPSGVLQTLKELSSLLLVVHSATNWLFFRKGHSSFEPQQSVPDYEIFDAQEKARLTSIWAEIDVSELGTDLLLTLLENNTSLIKVICPLVDDTTFDRNELLKQPRIVMVGSRIGQFIERMMHTLEKVKMTKDDFMEIRTELRSIGLVHFIERVKLTNQDWFLTKRFLVDLMLEKSKKGDERGNEEVANKFASFIIHEMKNGYVCESARSVHQSNSQFDRDQQASGRATPISMATVAHEQSNLKHLSSCPTMYLPKDWTVPSVTSLSIGRTASGVSFALDYRTVIDAESDVDNIIFVRETASDIRKWARHSLDLQKIEGTTDCSFKQKLFGMRDRRSTSEPFRSCL